MIFLTALRKELLEQWRTSRLVIAAVVLAVFGMLSPLLARYMPELIGSLAPEFANLVPDPTLADAITQYVKNIGQFILLLAIFLTMGAVAQEKERGTAVLMLVKPLGRGTFLAAKFIALGCTLLASLALAALLGYAYTLFLFEAPDLGAWLGMNALILLYALVYVALTLLASTLVRSQAAAAGISFGALLFLGVLGALPRLSEWLPGHLVAWGTSLFGGPPAGSLPALWASLGIIAACLLAAWLIFERQEL
jgi:ABC-2 type transport system permease protein